MGTYNLLRGYTFPIPGLSEKRQRAILHKAGIPDRDGAPIYSDTVKTFPRERKALIRSLRIKEGDVVAVARLCVLAEDRRDLRKIMQEIAEQKATVLEAETGRRSNSPECTAMTLDAVHYWSSRNKHFTDTDEAREAGALGSAKSAERLRNSRRPLDQVSKIWFATENRHKSNAEVLRIINSDRKWKKPYTESTIYRLLKKRDAIVGRKSKKR